MVQEKQTIVVSLEKKTTVLRRKTIMLRWDMQTLMVR